MDIRMVYQGGTRRPQHQSRTVLARGQFWVGPLQHSTSVSKRILKEGILPLYYKGTRNRVTGIELCVFFTIRRSCGRGGIRLAVNRFWEGILLIKEVYSVQDFARNFCIAALWILMVLPVKFNSSEIEVKVQEIDSLISPQAHSRQSRPRLQQCH